MKSFSEDSVLSPNTNKQLLLLASQSHSAGNVKTTVIKESEDFI